MTQDILPHLLAFYQQTFPEKINLKIKNLTALTVGWESIIYAFDAITGPKDERQTESLILRIYPGGDAYHKSAREFAGMKQLYQVGYPVPQVFILEREKSPFDSRPFILMERIEGEIMWPILDRSTPEQAAALITLFCELFVQLHALDWKDFVPADQQTAYTEPYFFIDGYLNWLRGVAESFPDLNALMPVIEWLQNRRDEVPCNRPAAVHWDFHPGNVILKPDGSAVVIDWTQIQVSDPRFDLGWTLLLTGGYAGDDAREMVLSEYQRISGAPIEQLAYFDVAACVKRIGSVMISLSSGADQMGMRPDAVAMMRRDFPALQRMYDLMVARTDIRVPEVEALLASNNDGC
jgi:aminoglycoside phosphotransferase (APT) family kinase protein